MGRKPAFIKETRAEKTSYKKPRKTSTNKSCKNKMSSKKSEAFIVDIEETKNEDTEQKTCEEENHNLQNAFLNYRKKRHEQMVVAAKSTKRKKHRKNSPKRMWALRMKFLAQCKKYIGTPYKRKYHEPGTPEYNSPLFLDCCGLIRRVLKDLRSDFAFEIGPWNQTYMYDTLPNTINRSDMMKPGDLVFISGVYYNSKFKRPPHGMVHVEVWLGEGQKTIGARWHKGFVQIFDSYRFVSTSYHTMRYHFKSIDTWLMGICKRMFAIGSHCPLHGWRLASDFRPTKRSVLHLVRLQQNASDEDHSQSSSNSNEQDQKENDNLSNSCPEDGAQEQILAQNQTVRTGVFSSGSSSQDSQESLMKEILLSGSDIIDVLREKLHVSVAEDLSTSANHDKRSFHYIQVTKSITLGNNNGNLKSSQLSNGESDPRALETSSIPADGEGRVNLEGVKPKVVGYNAMKIDKKE